MSKKIIFTSILLLFLGSLLIPGSIKANEYIGDLVVFETDTGLLAIRDEANPIVGNMVNATFSASFISLIIGIDGPGKEWFFNDIDAYLYDDYFDFETKGLSYFHNESLGFTEKAQDLILYGNHSSYWESINYLPGLIYDIEQDEAAAWDMLDFLSTIETTKNNDLISELENNYNATWYQLNKIYEYIKEYMYMEVVPYLITIGLHAAERPELAEFETIDEIIEYYFLQQWANGTIVGEPGFRLDPIAHLTSYPYGFEVGIPEPTNMDLDSARKLWDVSSPYSLVNKNGLSKWNYAVKNPISDIANYLKIANEIDDWAFEHIISWLPTFQTDLMPVLAQYQYSLPLDTVTLGNAIQMLGIIIGAAFLGLTAILLLRNTVKGAKKEKEVAFLHNLSNKVNDKND